MTEQHVSKKIESYIPQIRQCGLFKNISANELSQMLVCLNARLENFSRGQIIIREGDFVKSPGIVLSGSVYIQQTDFWGNTSIMNDVSVSDLFGETYAGLDEVPSAVEVSAAQNDTVILFVDMVQIRTPCASVCSFHKQLLANLLGILSAKNLNLTEKLTHVTQRTTRAKLLSYFSEQAAKADSETFTIPFNRQELADYLAVERSALSAELGRMRDDKIVLFDKNTFTLLQK